MLKPKKFVVSHAPFWHDDSNVSERHYHIILATLPAVLFGLFQYGGPAVGVISLSVSFAIFWELLMNYLTRRPVTIGDGNAALIGLLFGMLLPATSPWWLVITGTFVAMVIGKHIFGGIGGNPFNPALIGIAILMLSWKNYFNFDQALVNYDFGFTTIYPLMAVKYFGTSAIASFSPGGLLLGQQIGGIGSTFGLGLIAAGIYLMARGFIRWEISLSFLAGILLSAFLFNLYDASRFAGAGFHLFTGYTLIGAFFLATEDSSSPVNFIPMLIYGAGAGVLTVLIRNIGYYIDGVVFAILIMNILNPLLDKIRPQAIGKVV
ncbi:RnfABCDGE type electron transport complex subunit D [Thermodesulfobacteriota bacterium]